MPGHTLGSAYVQIIPSAKGIRGGIAQAMAPEATQAGQSAGETIAGKIKSIILAAGIGTAITAGIGAALNEGAALQQSLGGVETLFKDSADMMKNYASEAFKTCGLSANEYMEQATSFAASLIASTGGDTAKAADVANQALVDMSDNANKMGTSMEAIQNAYQGFAKQNYTMLDNLKLGYGGTKEEMQRLLNDAEKLSGVKYDISNLSDVYNAIHVIQENLGITGTTAREASETFSGSFAAMQAAARNLLGNIAIGADIGPQLQALAETTSTFIFGNFIPMLLNIVKAIPQALQGIIVEAANSIGPWINEMAKAVKEGFGSGLIDSDSLIAQLGSALAKMVDYILTYGPEFITAGGELLASLITGIGNALPELLSQFASLIANLIQSIVSSAPDWIAAGYGMISNIISGIAEAIPNIGEAFQVFSESLIATVQSIDWNTVGTNIMQAIVDGLGSLLSAVGSLVQAIWETFTTVDWIGLGAELLTAIINGIGSALSGMITVASEAASQLAEGMKTFDWGTFGSELMNSIVTGIRSLLGAVTEVGGAIVSTLYQVITSTDWLALGSQILTGVIQGVLSMLSGLLSAAVDAASQMTSGMKSVDWISLGSEVMRFIIDGIKALLGAVLSTAGEIAKALFDTLISVNWLDLGSQILNLVIQGLLALVGSLIGAVGQLAQSAWDAFIGFDWLSLGRNIVHGVIDGIGSMASQIWDAASNMASGFFDGVKSFFGIASPSKLMRDEIGIYIPQGMAAGILEGAGSMYKTMGNVSRKAAEAAEKPFQDLTIGPEWGYLETAFEGVTGTLGTAFDEAAGESRARTRSLRSFSRETSAVSPVMDPGSTYSASESIVRKLEEVAGRMEKSLNIILKIDGKQFAKATAQDMDKELRRLAVAR